METRRIWRPGFTSERSTEFAMGVIDRDVIPRMSVSLPAGRAGGDADDVAGIDLGHICMNSGVLLIQVGRSMFDWGLTAVRAHRTNGAHRMENQE